MAETSIISRIAIHATAETAPPSLPSKGTDITQSAWSGAGFETVGGRIGFGDDLDIDEESIAVTREEMLSLVDPPKGQAVEEAIVTKSRVTEVTFQCYDGSEALFTLVSNMTVASNIAELGVTSTYRTLVIETAGRWVDYYGRVLLQLMDTPGGAMSGEGVMRSLFRATVTKSTSAPGGWERRYYV